MEKKLIDAYDHMTMPEDCTRKIEARLQAELQNRKPGRYTKMISPYASRRSGWTAAAVCTMLILFMGGAALRLWLNNAVVDVPLEQAADYSVVTQFPASMVEEFAAEIRKNLLEEDWEAFSEKVQYPISILVRGLGDDTVVRERYITGDGGGLVGLFLRNAVNPSFLEEIRREKCTDMFCNWQGITMADGRIWINEIDGQLKITAINGVFADTADPQNFVLKLGPDGYVVTGYDGQEAEIQIPAGGNQNRVTQIGEGVPVIRYGDSVKVIQIPETIHRVYGNAFANCPAMEAVFFEGDAPPEAEGVFDGTENVTVYYRKGTKGWGDTWCGRKTMEYDGGYISLGTVTVQDRVPVIFQTVLSGEPAVVYGSREKLTAQEYCMEIWGDATANAFTLADMDRDGVCELIFSVQDADGVLLGYLVVRPDGAGIYGYTLRGRDLRKDGTYYSYTAKENSRLRFQDAISFFVESADFNQQDKPLVQWHVYPCQYPQLVLETYRYASETGFSTHPGVVLYSYFGTLLSKEADWSSVQPWLAEQSVYIEEKGSFYAFDPDAPGCLMYGTLIGTGEQQKLTALGYYICDETGEYRAEAFDLETSNPIYTVDPPPNDRGREVGSAEAMQDYFGVDFYGSDVSQDVQQIAELLDRFVERYSEHDTKGMREYMAEDAWELSSYPFTGEVSILSYGILPDAAVNVGESWHTSVELLESGDTKTYYHLSVALAKQPDGWKIHSYSLEEQ